MALMSVEFKLSLLQLTIDFIKKKKKKVNVIKYALS